MSKITFLTPTYNRGEKLYVLYKSIVNQHNCSDCIWMIIDDGSTDDTESIISGLKQKSPFEIVYYKKQNGGKHRALNFAIPLLNTPLTMVIDSDDFLTTDCIDNIFKYWDKYRNNPQIGSLIFERGRSSKKDPLVKIRRNVIARRTRYIENNRLYGDFNDVFITKYLQEFRLPEFLGEKFISEGPLYNEFSEKYYSVFIDEVIAIGDYNNGGLTQNSRELKLKNYKGSLYDLDQSISLCDRFLGKLKHSVLYGYIAFGSRANLFPSIKKSKHSLIITLTLPIGIICYLRDQLKGYIKKHGVK